MNQLGALLHTLRKETGEGIKLVAPRVGVSYTYLSKLENGRVVPSERVLRDLARYYQYDENKMLLAAGRVPYETLEILRRHPDEAIRFLREKFGSGGKRRRQS